MLEDGEFERVGGSEPVKVDARVLAATNRDLRAELAAGRSEGAAKILGLNPSTLRFRMKKLGIERGVAGRS